MKLLEKFAVFMPATEIAKEFAPVEYNPVLRSLAIVRAGAATVPALRTRKSSVLIVLELLMLPPLMTLMLSLMRVLDWALEKRY